MKTEIWKDCPAYMTDTETCSISTHKERRFTNVAVYDVDERNKCLKDDCLFVKIYRGGFSTITNPESICNCADIERRQ